MKTIALRLSRRAIGVAVLEDETLSFVDGRHLTSNKERALAAAERYLERIVELMKPTDVSIDAPAEPASTTAALLEVAMRVASAAGSRAQVVGSATILRAYGTSPVASRLELRLLIEAFWPELARLSTRVKPYLIDAAAAGLYAQIEAALNPVPT